jgi:hypothetical protein
MSGLKIHNSERLPPKFQMTTQQSVLPSRQAIHCHYQLCDTGYNITPLSIEEEKLYRVSMLDPVRPRERIKVYYCDQDCWEYEQEWIAENEIRAKKKERQRLDWLKNN